MELFGYFSSALMGLVLGLIGGGGSILTVPILVYLFDLTPVSATGSSLFVVGATALAGAAKFVQEGKVRIKESILFAIPSVLGVLAARRLLLPLIPPTIFASSGVVLSKDMLLMLMFATLMLTASLKMLRSPAKSSQHEPAVNNWLLPMQGAFVGMVTGFIGAGGGFLIVPALIFILGFKMQEAVGTSLLIIAANSLVGFSGVLGGTEVLRWDILVPVTVLAVFGMLLGARFQGKLSEVHLKKSFGGFVLIVGSLILMDQILRLKG